MLFSMAVYYPLGRRMDPLQRRVYEDKSYPQFKICDIAIREYIDKVGPGSRKDALRLLLAAFDNN